MTLADRKPSKELKKDRGILAARLGALMHDLSKLDMEPARSVDEDLRYTKGEKKNQRKRLSFYDRCDVTNSNGEHRLTIAARGPDNEPGCGVALHDSKGRVRIGLGINQLDQPGIQLIDENGITRLLISMGNKGVPAIIFKDEKGNESFVLSDFIVRLGKIGEEQIQLERKDSTTLIHIQGRKGSGSASIGTSTVSPALLFLALKT
jgi:hypothetical protein